MMEYTETFSVVDPLYELGVIKSESSKDIYSEIFGGEEKFSRLYERLVNSFEITRLNFLKQAGLLYLIFPSATHSRFAHSLGCFILGTYALENIWVKRGKSMIRLEQYLKQRKLREEFLIALLVHDIGHLPFSHYLEENEFVQKEYGNHEKITFSFLTEDSPLYKRLLQEAEKRETETVVQICKDTASIDVKQILMLLEEENKDPASQLVCGYLDLDRLDHYFRDSFFMGLKLASVNIKGFLHAIVIVVEDDPKESRFTLRSEGIPHVLHLLFGREMLWQRALDNDVNRAYQTMCVRAVSNWLEKEPEKIKDLPFMTEEILINHLLSSSESKKLMDLIFARKPYALMYKGETNMTARKLKNIFNEWMKKEADDKDDFLLFIPRNFNKPESAVNEWLLSDIPILEGKTLSELHGDLFDYFRKQHTKRAKTMRVFARNKELAEAKLPSLLKTLKNGE
jgi:HD superfamily phosphohydrolase